MRKYLMSFAESLEHKPEHPERTARQTAANGWDVVFQVWPNRPSMVKTIRIQERGAGLGSKVWRACVPLRETEGY